MCVCERESFMSMCVCVCLCVKREGEREREKERERERGGAVLRKHPRNMSEMGVAFPPLADRW